MYQSVSQSKFAGAFDMIDPSRVIATLLYLTNVGVQLFVVDSAITPNTRNGPGWFATVLRSLADIPREQPIRDNLSAIATLSSKFFDKALDPASRQMMSRGAMRFETTLRPEHLAEIRALAAASVSCPAKTVVR